MNGNIFGYFPFGIKCHYNEKVNCPYLEIFSGKKMKNEIPPFLSYE